MQLPQQLLKQISILVDKPIAPKVTGQIKNLLQHENLPLEKTVNLFSSRHRSDLLIFLFENNKYPIYDKSISCSFPKFCQSLLKNIIQYRLKITQIIRIYLLLLTKVHSLSVPNASDNQRQLVDPQSMKKLLLQIGYSQLARLVVKQPNLQTKQLLMKIINANTQFLYSIKHKKLIQSMTDNFIEIYQKYLIYIPSYIRMIEIIIKIDYNSKKIINQKSPEKSDNFEEIFIDLSSKQLYMITVQSLKVLENTAEKVNYYELHNICFKVLTAIGQTLNAFRIKQSSSYFKALDILTILRNCQKFISKKSTMDQARFCKNQWKKFKCQQEQLKVLKGQKILKNQQQIVNASPILIENVIAATNNYRLKYEVQNPLNQREAHFQISVANNFLRKQCGVGGGKTFFINKKQAQPQQHKNQTNNNKAAYDRIIDSCFNNFDKQLQYKSYVQPVINFGLNQFRISQSKSKQYGSQQMQRNIEQFVFNNNQSGVSSFQADQKDDQQIQEIGNLIDLAYSYKFS